MTGERVCSSPDLLPLSFKNHEDLSLEGIATNVKLLHKLVQDHQNISVREAFDDRKTQRFAGMMTILDDVKTRLQKSQTSGIKKKPELRRCNTDLRIHNPPRDVVKKDEGLILDEKERLKRDLNISLVSQKRLGAMCASLGREKEIIVRELTRKVQEVNEMEQLINDLKAQNERLSTKLQACAPHKTENDTSETIEELNVIALRERNKELCDQLLKCLEGYRLMKRRLKETQEEKEEMKATMEELGDEIQIGIEKIHSLRQHLVGSDCGVAEGKIEENIVSIYQVFKEVEERVSKYRKEGRQ